MNTTVKDLIDILKKADQNLLVVVSADDGACGYKEVQKDYFKPCFLDIESKGVIGDDRLKHFKKEQLKKYFVI